MCMVNDETLTIPLPYEHKRCSSFTFTQVIQIENFAQPTYIVRGFFEFKKPLVLVLLNILELKKPSI